MKMTKVTSLSLPKEQIDKIVQVMDADWLAYGTYPEYRRERGYNN